MMEPVFKTISNTLTEELKQTLTYTPEKQRYLWYTDKISKHNPWHNVCWFENDEILVYSETTLGLRMAKKLFPFVRTKKGFTFEKKTNKLKMWYRTQPHSLTPNYFNQFLIDRKHEWVVNEGFTKRELSYRRDETQNSIWLTGGLLGKILAGKISNPTEATEYIIKTNRLKGIDPKPLRQYIKDSGQKATFFYCQDVITNPLDILTHNKQNNIPFDLLKQAKALGRKIDLGWSRKRIDETHTQFTRELMAAELDMMEDEFVDWEDLADILPPGVELITSKKRLFEEGTIMDHCVYTNYWQRVQRKDYMVLHVSNEEGEHATAGIALWSGRITLDQIQAKRNTNPHKDLENTVRALLSHELFIDKVKMILSRPSKKEVEEDEPLPF